MAHIVCVFQPKRHEAVFLFFGFCSQVVCSVRVLNSFFFKSRFYVSIFCLLMIFRFALFFLDCRSVGNRGNRLPSGISRCLLGAS